MPLVDLKTDLKSLKYGRDRLNGGSSGEPYVTKDINGLKLSDLHRTGGSDLLVRGGFLLGERTINDVKRLGKYLTSPEGLLWSTTQNVLSESGVRIYGGYPNLVQTANSFRLNDGTYLPTSTLLQLPLGPFGGHLNKQGTDPTGLTVLGRPEYIKLQRDLKTVNSVLPGSLELNRLLYLRNEHISNRNLSPNIYTYLGGPGAGTLAGGIGKTAIRFADQRTGSNLKTKLYWDSKNIPTTFNSNLIDITQYGVSSKSSSEFSSYFNSPITFVDNQYSIINGYRIDSKPATSKFYIEKRDTTINRAGVLNVPNEAPINVNGNPNPNFDPSSIKDIKTIAREYTENFEKEYKVKGGPETAENFDISIPNPDRRFDNPTYRDSYLDQAKVEGVSSKSSSPLAPSDFQQPTNEDNGIDGNNTISSQGQLDPNSSPTQKSYATPPNGKEGATIDFNNTNPVYGDIINTTPSPFEQEENSVKEGNDATLTKEELYKTADETRFSNTVIDFRRRVKKKNTPIARKNGALSDSLNWDANPSKQIETRVGLGDPGSPNIDRSDYTKGGGNARTGVDKINSLYLYKDENVTSSPRKNDLVKFRIATLDPDNPSLKTFAHFRAFIDDINDEYSANWDSYKYMGRGEEFFNYGGFTRNMGLSWTVFAQSKEELSIQYQKLNYLASTLAPNYSNAGFMRGNIHQLTIGGYVYEYPGIITSLNFNIPNESPWEISIPVAKDQTSNTSGTISSDSSVKELPHMIKVQMSFKPIHEFLPQTVGSSFDTGNPEGIFGDKQISQRFISLEDSNANGTNDLYSDGIPDYAKL